MPFSSIPYPGGSTTQRVHETSRTRASGSGAPVAATSSGFTVWSRRLMLPPTCVTLPAALAVSQSSDWPGVGREGAITIGRSVVCTPWTGGPGGATMLMGVNGNAVGVAAADGDGTVVTGVPVGTAADWTVAPVAAWVASGSSGAREAASNAAPPTAITSTAAPAAATIRERVIRDAGIVGFYGDPAGVDRRHVSGAAHRPDSLPDEARAQHVLDRAHHLRLRDHVDLAVAVAASVVARPTAGVDVAERRRVGRVVVADYRDGMAGVRRGRAGLPVRQVEGVDCADNRHAVTAHVQHDRGRQIARERRVGADHRGVVRLRPVAGVAAGDLPVEPGLDVGSGRSGCRVERLAVPGEDRQSG